MLVGLEALEDFLRVVQDGARGVDRDRCPGLDASVIPALRVGVSDRHHVIGKYPTKAGIHHQSGTFGVRYGRRIRTNLEFEAVTTAHSKRLRVTSWESLVFCKVPRRGRIRQYDDVRLADTRVGQPGQRADCGPSGSGAS